MQLKIDLSSLLFFIQTLSSGVKLAHKTSSKHHKDAMSQKTQEHF